MKHSKDLDHLKMNDSYVSEYYVLVRDKYHVKDAKDVQHWVIHYT